MLTRLFDRVLATVLVMMLCFTGMTFAPSTAAAAPDSTVTVSTTSLGTFGSELIGGNLSPWGLYWPDTKWNPLINDAGIGILRRGHASKYYVDMEKWYPSKGCTPDWDAQSGFDWIVADNKASFNQQIAWLKGLNMPVMYTLTDEMSTAMLKPDGTLDYPEIARAWTLHIKHMLDAGVDIRWVEIGNECDIQPTEGIQYPPVAGTNGGSNGSSKYIDIWTNQNSANNEYIKLWSAVYPALKAQFPNLKIGAYPSGMGPIMTNDWPFNYLFQTSPYKPDFFAYHQYMQWQGEVPPQRALDDTWSYAGSYVDWNDQLKTFRSILTGWGAPANIPIFLTEYNYDSSTKYSTNDQMWDAVWTASALLNSANGRIDGTYLWDTFCGSNTGGAIGPDYQQRLHSEGLGLRLMKQFKGSTILANTVTTADLGTGPVSPSDGHPVSPNVSKRIEALATRWGSTYRIMVLNKNVAAAHQVGLNLAALGLSNQTATVQTYDARADLANNAPAVTTQSLSAGSATLDLPALSVAVVTVLSGPDTTAPTVSVTSPTNGSKVTGAVSVTANASDNTAVSKVEFRINGRLVGTDTTAPYSTTWSAPSAYTQGPVVSFTFDDGMDIQYTGCFPILSAAGFPATTYVHSGDVVNNYDWKLSLPELTALRDAGWEISNHTSDHWDSVTDQNSAAQLEPPVAAGKAWLDANGFPNSGFASPNAWVNPTITSVVKKYHTYNRTSWGVQELPPADPYMLKVDGSAAIIDNNPSVTALRAILDDAVANKRWIIFLNHVWNPPSGYFTTVVNEVKARNLPVATVRDVLGGPYAVEATAYDAAGNKATSRVDVTSQGGVTPPADTTAPTVSITTPANGATVSGSVLLSANAYDAQSGIGRVEFRVDGTLVGTSYPPMYTAVWDTSTALPGTHTLQATAYDSAGNSSQAAVYVQVAAAVDPPPAAAGTFTNDFSAGQSLNTAYLEPVASGGGSAALGAGVYTLASPSSAGSAFLSFRNAVPKTTPSSYAVRFRVTGIADGSNLGLLSMNASPTRSTGRPVRNLDASFVRSGVTHGFQLTRIGTDGSTRYYTWANATWGTVPAKLSLQANTVYIVKFETNSSGQFRYVVCNQSGSPLVNGTTVWTSFATIHGDASNNYWPYVGDAFTDQYSGTVELLSVSGPAPDVPPPGDTTPPAVSITSPANGATVTGIVPIAATAADTGGSGLARVEFRIDGALRTADTSAPYTDSWDASVASPGTHVIAATAVDGAGNSTSSSIQVTVPVPPDTTPPVVTLTSPANGANVSGSVTLAATASDTGGSGLVGVEFRVDGATVANDTTAPYSTVWNAAAATPGPHTVVALATDGAGNSSSASVQVTVVVPDTTPPTVSITSPANGATVTGIVPIAATAADTGGSGLARVEFRIDGALRTADTSAPYTDSWDASVASPGTHVIAATAVDGAGNSTSSSIQVTVPVPPDTTPPVVTLTSPANGANVSGSVTLAATASDTGGSGLVGVEFRVDGATVANDTTAPYSTVWNAAAATPGPHTVVALATDGAGNSSSASVQVTVVVPDTTPPTVSITSPANGATISTAVTVMASGTDAGSGMGGVVFYLDGVLLFSDTTYPYSTTWDPSTSAVGPHTITASGYDLAGNRTAVSVQVYYLPPPPSSGPFTNDFSAGQSLNTAYLEPVASGGGSAALGAGVYTLASPSSAGSAFLGFRNAVPKTTPSSYAVRFRVTGIADGSNLGLLSMNASPTRSTGRPVRNLDASFVRSGVTHGFQLTRIGTDGSTRYYTWANATWGTVPAKLSLQANTVYIVKFETNSSGQFRYVVCNQSGSPLVNGTTVWTSFATIHGDASNNYWPYVGDAFTDQYSGTVELLSVSGQ